jgi:hypothetical protein
LFATALPRGKLTRASVLPATPWEKVPNFFYGTVHFDRRVGGWFYPLVEFNWAYHTRPVDLTSAPRIPDFYSLDVAVPDLKDFFERLTA